MRRYPSPDTWRGASKRQRNRAQRSFKQLKKRKVPVYDGPLVVDDDKDATLQDAQEVARRTLVLWAVELRAEGTPQEEAIELIDTLDLGDSVSPEEKRFLEDPKPRAHECQALVWRLESIWVLLWALGYLEELDWPSDMCNVPKLVNILEVCESSAEFITEAELRDKAEILDAQDLIVRIHWAIREAYLSRDQEIPANLDWSKDAEMLPVSMCHGVGVVEQRHHTLNWLVNFPEPAGWDDVETPT
ncbi:hypothetical protein Pan216_44390 [Planctomycetes bacterium Pan216]|uniref:DUF4272 domain-containing protein n=1 Tax=Kolteria novifilia TaxID=2527975 RepID=A0A518B9B0_9BACT|nr:hypothetical protein Pan216_44390 [Planctomycetes bacterium Pan216]